MPLAESEAGHRRGRIAADSGQRQQGVDVIRHHPAVPDGHDADELRNLALDHFNISYGTSFGGFTGKYFRIGHLGDTNDLTILGALAGTEMALALAGVPFKKGGVQAAMDYIASVRSGAARVAAE